MNVVDLLVFIWAMKLQKKLETTLHLLQFFHLVLKNGVRFSSNLSYTLGFPSCGSIVFVYPIQSEFHTGLVNGSKKGHNLNANCVSLCSCKQSHLELTSFMNTVNTNNDISSEVEFSTGKTHN